MAAPTYEPVAAVPELTPAEEKKARQEALLAQVIAQPAEGELTADIKERPDLDNLEDEQYYPEPQEEII
jgi:hypothetical protein